MAEGKLAYGDEEEFRNDIGKSPLDLNPVDKISEIYTSILIIVGSLDNVKHPDDCKSLYEKITSPKNGR